jgi:hypothetical protein
MNAKRLTWLVINEFREGGGGVVEKCFPMHAIFPNANLVPRRGVNKGCKSANRLKIIDKGS